MKSNNTPEIRFAGFTEEWEARKFENVLNKQDGIRRGPFGSTLKKEIFVKDSDYVVYEQQNAIYDNYETRYNITKEKFEELKNFQLSEGDFILSGAGTIGRISRVPRGIKQGVFNQALIRFKIDENITDSEYFIQWIRAENMQRKLTGANPGSAITNLVPMAEVKKWDVMVPSKNEQTKIGNFLKQLDETIALHQQELTILKQTKQGFLQKMFPKEGESVPEVRFPGFNGEWEERKLKDIAVFNPKSVLPEQFEYVDLESVVGTNLISHRTEHKESAPSRAQRLAKQGDIFYQTVRPYQKNNYLFDLPYDNYVFSTGYAQLRPNIDSYFLFSKLQEEKFVSEVLDRCTGTSYPAINSNHLAQIQISVPTLEEEQNQVGSFFRRLDQTITLHQRELDALQEMKKAFLQKMFV